MPSEKEVISGVVRSILYRAEDSGYCVARLEQDDLGDEVIIVGTMSFLGAGEHVFASGTFLEHPSYGLQFKIDSCERELPKYAEDIESYLASGIIKGVGAKTAEYLVAHFRDETLEIIENDPIQLCEIKGITKKRAFEINEAYMMQNALKWLIDFFAQHNLPTAYTYPLTMKYGVNAITHIRQNPYLLCDEPMQLGFLEADHIAQELGKGSASDDRLKAAILFELRFNAQNGHVFIPEDKLLLVTEQLCGAAQEELYPYFDALCQSGHIVREEIGGRPVYYLAQLYIGERFIGENLRRLQGMKVLPHPKLQRAIDRLEKEAGISYSEEQKQAMALCFESAISLITGGPGTGKTTILLSLVRLLEESGLKAYLAAPTGRAAQRMSQLCQKEAKTLHRLLEASFDNRQGRLVFKKDNGNPLDCDVLIVDEASMLELSVTSALFDALKPHTRVVLIGDCDQLPPIGAGNVFSDMLQCEELPRVRLKHIFRQAQNSGIVQFAHGINRGEYRGDIESSDFFFIPCRSPDKLLSNLNTLISERIPQKYGIEPGDVQVICPSRMLWCGTNELNRFLQASQNPQSSRKPEIRFEDRVFRKGDRVMQIKNNYDLLWRRVDTGEVGAGIFNGDTGQIIDVDPSARVLMVRFDGVRDVECAGEQVFELEHAYAITAHKAQGSEYDAVIIPLFSVPERLLSRNLLYTAATRASKLLIVIGRQEVMHKMIENDKKTVRYSALRRRVSGSL